MRIFVTGASGHVGSVVVPELLRAGHQVVGLARSDASEEKLRGSGAEVIRGSLEDLDIIRATAQDSDGVIHLAFRHDIAFSGDMEGAVDTDRQALETIAEALAGTNKPLVGVGGTLVLAIADLGRPGREDDVPSGNGRGDNENYVIGLAKQGIRSSVVRLAPTVHGPHDNPTGFIPTLMRAARQKGVAAYVADGQNHWPAIHDDDAASLFRLAVEKAPAGSRLHGAGEEAIVFKDIAESFAARLDIQTKSISAEEADTYSGHLGNFIALDNPVSNEITRQLLGWQPRGPGLLTDIDSGVYDTLSE